MRRRVEAYLTRTGLDGGCELLVFDCPVGCGLECPGGGIDDNEEPAVAVLREIHEETGLTDVRVIRELGATAGDFGGEAPEPTVWFHVVLTGGAPDAWEHVVHGGGGDDGFVHPLRWEPLPLQVALAAGHDALLHLL
jgi:8-oxo-dGTP pyrophosphatase MutT (NUDIX family)